MTDEELRVPDQYDDASFRAGYAQAMTHIGHMALSGAGDVNPANQQSGESDEMLVSDDGEDDDVVECQTCGQSLLSSMGSDETDHSPAGCVCPACDL